MMDHLGVGVEAVFIRRRIILVFHEALEVPLHFRLMDMNVAKG